MVTSYSICPQDNFFRIFGSVIKPTFKVDLSPIHKHAYSEVHIVEKGNITIFINGEEYFLESGNAIIIPKNLFHRIISGTEIRRHYAFQTDIFTSSIAVAKFPEALISSLFGQMEIGKSGINILSYICLELTQTSLYQIENEYDYKHTIGNFFDKRHNEDVKVKDLASVLNLSVMQTQRLVKKYTGMTFGENIQTYRIKVADYLLSTTNLTKEEIAYQVGYQSYSGFWKARNKLLLKNK